MCACVCVCFDKHLNSDLKIISDFERDGVRVPPT